jgi:hypothetical protein
MPDAVSCALQGARSPVRVQLSEISVFCSVFALSRFFLKRGSKITEQL